MNPLQTRLLQETEFKFYQLQVPESSFQKLLKQLGYKPVPDLSKITDEQLKRLNVSLRKHLRSAYI